MLLEQWAVADFGGHSLIWETNWIYSNHCKKVAL